MYAIRSYYVDRLGLPVEFFVHDEGVAFVLDLLVGITRLVQSQRKPRPSSPARGQIDPDGGDFLVREVLVQLVLRGLGVV